MITLAAEDIHLIWVQFGVPYSSLQFVDNTDRHFRTETDSQKMLSIHPNIIQP